MTLDVDEFNNAGLLYLIRIISIVPLLICLSCQESKLFQRSDSGKRLSREGRAGGILPAVSDVEVAVKVIVMIAAFLTRHHACYAPLIIQIHLNSRFEFGAICW